MTRKIIIDELSFQINIESLKNKFIKTKPDRLNTFDKKIFYLLKKEDEKMKYKKEMNKQILDKVLSIEIYSNQNLIKRVNETVYMRSSSSPEEVLYHYEYNLKNELENIFNTHYKLI